MPSDTRPPLGEYLLRQLRSCSGPMAYRSGVSLLLGVPARDEQRIGYLPSAPPVGFRYRLPDAVDRDRPRDPGALHLSSGPASRDRPGDVSDAWPTPPTAGERAGVRTDQQQGYATSLDQDRAADEAVGAPRAIDGPTAPRQAPQGEHDAGGAPPPAHQPRPVALAIPGSTAPRTDEPGRLLSASMPAAAGSMPADAGPKPPLAPAHPRPRDDGVVTPVGDGPQLPPRDVRAAAAGSEPAAGRPRAAAWSRDLTSDDPVSLSPRPHSAASPDRPPAPRPPVTDAPTMVPRSQPAARQQLEQLRDAGARLAAQPPSQRREAWEQPATPPPATPPPATPPPAARRPVAVRPAPRMGSGIPRAFWASSTLRSRHLGVLR